MAEVFLSVLLMKNLTVFSSFVRSFSDEIDQLLTSVAGENAVAVQFLPTLKLILGILIVALAFGIVFRLIFGKGSSPNRSISSALGILAIYALTVVIYTLNPWKLDQYLSPLPFALFRGDILILLPFTGARISTVSSHILSLLVLSFLVNLLDAVIPQGENILLWFVLRIITVVAAMFLNLAANWAFKTYLPELLTVYAPVVLLVVLVTFLLLGIIQAILGIVLTATNPILGAIYFFFFSSFIGKQISKSVITTGILCGLIRILEYFGYSVILIVPAALLSYIPFVAVMVLLWFLLGREL